jgi:hypothetical protein
MYQNDTYKVFTVMTGHYDIIFPFIFLSYTLLVGFDIKINETTIKSVRESILFFFSLNFHCKCVTLTYSIRIY